MNSKYLRTAGILGSAVGCILYFASLLTNYWAETEAQDVNWGLWNYCTNLTSKNESLQVQNMTILNNIVFTSTTAQTNTDIQTNSTNDVVDEQNQEECEQFSFSVIPGMFHLVRAFMVFGTIVLAYCILSCRILKHKIDTGEPWYIAHRGEICLLFGACSGMIASIVFESSYRSYDFDDHGELKLGSSHGIAKFSAFLIGLGASLMLAPRLKDKFLKCVKGERFSFSANRLRHDPLGTCYHCLLCQERQTSQTREPRSAADVSVVRRSSVVSLDDTFIADTVSDYNEPSIFMVDIRNSPLHFSRNNSASLSDPAPRYEDLSPGDIEALPPPPTYDEVVAGRYAITDTAASSEFHPTAPPTSLSTHEPDLPPPSYEESAA